MAQPLYARPNREDWDEYDWERFLQRADVRTAKFQELFETLEDDPQRDTLIAREMGWDSMVQSFGCRQRDCEICDHRFECEAYEMLYLMAEPDSIENDPEAADLLASFEQVREIPAYCAAHEFAGHLEDALRCHACDWARDNTTGQALMAAQMVPAHIAGGHGIGYERDSLCGNIANCKRAYRCLRECLDDVRHLEKEGVLDNGEVGALVTEGESTGIALQRWIETLRTRIWWR